MTESPVSADLDNSLSSYDASNNDLSSYESYGLSDSSEYGSWKSYDNSLDNYNYHKSNEFSNSLVSYDSYVSYEFVDSCDSYISCGSVELSDSCDSYVSCGSVELLDSCDSYVSCGLSDSFDICKLINYSNSYRPFGLDKLSQINVELNNDVNDVGEFAPIEVVDNDVISTNYNGYSKEVDIDSIENLDNFNIFVSASAPKSLTRKVIGLNDDAIISEVTSDVEASESYLFGIDVGPQKDNLDELNHDGAVLAGVTIGLSIICDAGEPVFDGILISSGYISENEVYFGAISDSDWNILFESVGAENLYLFACLTEDWNSDLAFDILKDVTLHEKFDKFEIDGYKFTKALLKYCISTNEIIISLESDSEDEHGHVINDTNSHGLDYAYIKHVNVIYKDMPNLLVLTSSGCEKQSTEGSWDALNDILGSGVSSETLLPDHKAIWTPLLLLTQQDLKESSEESHADDNGNNILNNSKNRDAGKKCMCDNKCLCLKYNCSEFNCSCHKHHHHGGGHHHHRHWGHNGYNPGYYQVAATSIVTNDLIKNDNSTDDKNKSSNVTATNGEKKSISSPKSTPKGEEPTYTLVYAIIGIVLISLLFNSSYMKRD